MATVVEKVASFGADVATITATKDTTLNVYTGISYTVTSGTLTVSVSIPGQPTLNRSATASGSLIVPSSNYLIGSADVFGSWHA